MEAHTLGSSPRKRRTLRSDVRPPSRLRRVWARVKAFEREWSVAGPAVFVLVAATLLIYNHVQQKVPDLTFWLGLALIGTVFFWILEDNHRRAVVDPVTGLANRLQLRNDLRDLLESPGKEQTLVLLELEGVTDYRDRLGFQASDELLRSFSHSLGDVVRHLGGKAYRVDGNQFCALVPAEDRDANEIAMALFVSGTHDDDETTLGRAHGVVTLPDDASDPDEALGLAGQRLAADKRLQHQSAKHQAHDALMALINARRPEMGPHLRSVAYHAISVGRQLGLNREQLDDVVFAARLQHIGMLSVPDAVIESQSHLPAADSIVIRSLPVAGAEIIASAPALTSVAALVHSSHENYDGSGYPDNLAGDEIPLGSRILSVCEAYVVLTAKRTDVPPLTQETALMELRHSAGIEFDPRVVEALADDLAE
jgi:two-component system, cell cycle response regulator